MLFRSVEPLAWDAAGRLYSLWADTTGMQLARSADRGTTWTRWRIAEPHGVSFYAFLIARGRGELAATWFSTTTRTREDMQWHVARVDLGDGDAAPRVIESSPRALESWRRYPGEGETLYRDPGGEYTGLSFLRDGGLGVVSPIQNAAANRMGFTWWRFDVR